jgi:hypothetical protein
MTMASAGAIQGKYSPDGGVQWYTSDQWELIPESQLNICLSVSECVCPSPWE